MNHIYLTADFYNKSISCKFDDITYVFSSVEKFFELTGYPYSSTTGYIAYEPLRNSYALEKIGEISVQNSIESEEMQWIITNLDVIKQAAIDDLVNHYTPELPTLAMHRDMLLHVTDWILQRYQEETLLNLSHSITNENLISILEYRQTLRDLTKIFPDMNSMPYDINSTFVWPTNPLV